MIVSKMDRTIISKKNKQRVLTMNKISDLKKAILTAAISSILLACSSETPNSQPVEKELKIDALETSKPAKKINQGNLKTEENSRAGKPVIYQVFTRLFGNKNTTNKQWGTIEENGVGKFNDFTDEALLGIKEFGTTHVWYTGVPHHDVITDYTKYGISNDDPDIVKGRAGSPYAIKDYYNVNPDLAVDPANRLQEFKNLIERTHKHGMKVIIDIVPNHIARNYKSLTNPEGVEDFGANDDTSVEYRRDNNFYYVIGENFKVPESKDGYKPLGGESHPLADGYFKEEPAKWTGNGSRRSQPDINDWYETVKVNYGVKPDGSYDFDRLPADFKDKSYQQHFDFWQAKEVPDSWVKFKDIVLYWLDFGVDGFRYDMAEMVPVEFWSYLNSAIKVKNPNATTIAEIYNPTIYRDYIYLGKMDYLYDKVDLYDNLKRIMQGKQPAASLNESLEKSADIDQYMVYFLENHDEQRIASEGFAGSAEKGKPGMVVSSLVSQSATMLYFAQALGEAGDGDAGFGDPTRTSIFDYWGIPSLQRWMNGGKFDGAKLTEQEKSLRDFYVRLLTFSANSSALKGDYFSLNEGADYEPSLFLFSRWYGNEKLIVASNFSDSNTSDFKLIVPKELIIQWNLEEGSYQLADKLSVVNKEHRLTVTKGQGTVSIKLEPLESVVLQFY